METVSRFDGLSFKKTAVISGKKVNASSRPELILNPTKDSFSLNPKASQMMGVAPGERVVLMDLGQRGKDINCRFFIAPSYKKGDIETGAKVATVAENGGIGSKLNFSYAGIWAAMLFMAKTESKETEVGIEDLTREDIVNVKETPSGKTSYTSKVRLRFKLEPIGTQVVDDYDGQDISAPVYALIDVESDDLTAANAAE